MTDTEPRTRPITIAVIVVLALAGAAWWLLRPGGPFHLAAGVVRIPANQGTLPASVTPGATVETANLAYGPDPVQRIDLYRPPQLKGPLPVLVYLHSGGWISGERQQVPDFLLREVTRLNVVLASVGYRLSAAGGVNTFPAAPEDVDRAIRWLDANAAFLGLDPTRVIVTGTSAGGHLAALEGAAPGVFVAPGLPAQLAAVQPKVIGVIDAVGPSDLLSFGKEHGLATALVGPFIGCSGTTTITCSAATLRDASVAPHLTTFAPPAFLVYGQHDTLVRPATQGRPLAAAWARARDETAKPVSARGVWYEEANDGHNVSQSSIDVVALEQWLTAVLSGQLR